MNKNRWFKHWNTAHQGQTIQQLWSERDGPEVIAFYWTILEMVSLYEAEPGVGLWEANLSFFKSKLGMNRNRSYKLLCKIGETFETKITWKSPESFQLFVTNWPELQETRGGKRDAKKEQSAERSKKREVRSKKEDIYSSKGDEVSGAVEGGLKTTDLVNLWNSLANPSLARVIKLTDGRKRAIARALREYPEAEFWQDVIQAVNKSQFLTGQGAVSGNRSKPWRCDLDFIVRGDNAIKILEGKYS